MHTSTVHILLDWWAKTIPEIGTNTGLFDMLHL